MDLTKEIEDIVRAELKQQFADLKEYIDVGYDLIFPDGSKRSVIGSVPRENEAFEIIKGLSKETFFVKKVINSFELGNTFSYKPDVYLVRDLE